MKYNLREICLDGMTLVGVALLSYGAWLAWPPAGFMVGGLAVLSGALGMSRANL